MHLVLLCCASPGIEYASCVPPRYEALIFVATDCPLARRYMSRLNELADRYPQVHFQAIAAELESAASWDGDFAKELRFTFRRDSAAIRRHGATRSPEALFVVNGEVVYRGRIDDQYSPGTDRGAPLRRDFEIAIQETLARQPVSVRETSVTGCYLTLPAAADGNKAAITYPQIAGILHRRCAECHRPGQVAPFSLLSYRDAAEHKETIRDCVTSGRMPPWHADPRYGKFANDRSLSPAEKERLLTWIDGGAAAGDSEPPLPQFPDGWAIRPDVIRQMPSPFSVPAEGILDYQEFSLPSGFAEDRWIQAAEIRPGNRAVVHHINVFLRPPGAERETLYYNELRDLYFMTMVPGNAAARWPAETAKLIPAGWSIVLSIHYQPSGSPEMDQTSIALELADAKTVRQQMATRAMYKDDLLLPPHSVTTLTNEWRLEDDYTLHALMPHMHLRGRSMRVEADGEVLLAVPHFDFNWQHRYVLATPKRLPRGAILRCTAEFDNTAANPNNPDPTATVREGQQSTDEMFQLNLDITRTRENRLAQRSHMWLMAVALLAGALLLAGVRSVRVGQSA